MPQMRSRREQVEAHRFITSRMNQALVLANPDSIERPLRRIGVSIFASVMILVLIFGGFAIATLFGKGNDAPLANNVILVKETGAVYVYINKAKSTSPEEAPPGDPLKLWPVANFTSALLLAKPGSDGKLPVQTLKRSSLANIPRGNFTIGIEGLPSQPPDESELLQTERWNACSLPRNDGSTAGYQLTQLVVENMEDPDMVLGDDHWMLAKTAVNETDGEVPDYFLLWNNSKFAIAGDTPRETDELISSLEFQKGQAVPINQNVLDTLPSTAPIKPKKGTDFGTASGIVDDSGNPVTYGQPVISGDQHYVLLHENGVDQFAEINETMTKLLETEYGDVATISAATRSEVGTEGDYEPKGFPTTFLSSEIWEAEGQRPAVCVVYDPTSEANKSTETTELSLALYDAAPDSLTNAAKSVEFDGDGNIFSEVEGLQSQTVLPPGTAVLADARTNDGGTITGFTYLIDSLGARYGLVDEGITDSTQQLLGYQGVTPISVPDEMIILIPKGADINPHDARQQIYPDGADVPGLETADPSAEAGG